MQHPHDHDGHDHGHPPQHPNVRPDADDTLTYYERWIYSISQTLIQRGVIAVDELGRKMTQVEARQKDQCR